jgi:phospholipid transport system transporter-binding protein
LAQLIKDGNRIRVSGAMTMLSVPALLDESAAVFVDDNLEVDLAQVDEVDSAALSLLFEWLREAHARNASLVFVNLPANLTSLATLYGVLDFIPQHTH